jgi:DNA-binding PadR family transcriptional regulator
MKGIYMRDDFFSEDFRFFRAGHRVGRGDIRPLILMLLQDKPMHGYEIISALEERSHGFWRPSAGTIYPNLQLLEEQELLKSVEEDGKKIYSLTEKGAEQAKQSQNEKHDFNRHHHFKGGEMFMALHPVIKQTMGLLREISMTADPSKAEQAKVIIEEMNDKLSGLIKD